MLCLRGHENEVTSVAFSPDGTRIASASLGETRVWDARTGDCLEVLEGWCDVKALAAGPSRFPCRARGRALETAIEDAAVGVHLVGVVGLSPPLFMIAHCFCASSGCPAC